MTNIILAALLSATLGAPLQAAPTPGSRLWLEGDSTLHPYRSDASTFTFSLSLPPGLSLSEVLAQGATAALKLVVPVKGLRSEHSGLDGNLRKALKADKNPDIIFTLDSYKVAKGTASDVVTAAGRLSVAGVERPAEVAGTLTLKDGRTLLTGEKALLMTDFGVKPPVMMFGAVKTADKVTVRFEMEIVGRRL